MGGHTAVRPNRRRKICVYLRPSVVLLLQKRRARARLVFSLAAVPPFWVDLWFCLFSSFVRAEELDDDGGCESLRLLLLDRSVEVAGLSAVPPGLEPRRTSRPASAGARAQGSPLPCGESSL